MDLQQFFLDFGLPPAIVVIVIATFPVVELRGAIPVAVNALDFSWYGALIFAVIGNMLPVPLILRLLNWLVYTLSRYPIFNRFFDWLLTRTRARSGLIKRYKNLGLTLFVAIPLPMTGAWTGAIAAVLLDIPFSEALRHIFIGVILAGVIVTALSVMGWWGAFIAVLAILTILIVNIVRRRSLS